MPDDRFDELEIKLAFQDNLIRELETLVRSFGDRLDAVQRELTQLKKAVESPDLPLVTERPPHY